MAVGWASPRCEECPAGKLSKDGGRFCGICSPGEYIWNSTSCEKCTIGTYAETAKVDYCEVCGDGRRTDKLYGATSCVPCPPGSMSTAPATNCTLCIAGKYSAIGASECELCDYGTAQGLIGQASCVNCRSGRSTLGLQGAPACSNCSVGSASGPRASTCIDCVKGFHAPVTGLGVCMGCASGTAAPSTGAINCTLCEAGFISAARAIRCSKCLRGQYGDASGASQCLACSAGTYSNATGATSCISCLPGKAQGATGQTSCLECEASKSSPKEGSVSCEPCDKNRDSVAGAITCDRCIPDFFLAQSGDIGETRCLMCPKNARCDGGRLLAAPVSGYWVDTSSPEFVSKLYRCPRSTCKGAVNKNNTVAVPSCWQTAERFANCSSAASELLCEEGSHAPLCGSCDENRYFSPVTNRCELCSDGSSMLQTWLTLGALAIIKGLIQAEKLDILPGVLRGSFLVGLVSNVDWGSLKVVSDGIIASFPFRNHLHTHDASLLFRI